MTKKFTITIPTSLETELLELFEEISEKNKNIKTADVMVKRFILDLLKSRKLEKEVIMFREAKRKELDKI